MATQRGKRRPGTTPEARENQLISDAMDLAERQLQAGTASAQVITHFLKAGSSRDRLERERLRNENLLLETKVDMMGSQKRSEELFEEAIKAFRQYSGQDDDDEEEFYDDYEFLD